MSSDIDLYLRNYHHNQNSEHTHSPKVSSCPSQPFSPTRPHLLSQATTDLSLQINWCSLAVYVDESAQCILFWVASFIWYHYFETLHVVACFTNLFFFKKLIFFGV